MARLIRFTIWKHKTRSRYSVFRVSQNTKVKSRSSRVLVADYTSKEAAERAVAELDSTNVGKATSAKIFPKQNKRRNIRYANFVKSMQLSWTFERRLESKGVRTLAMVAKLMHDKSLPMDSNV